MAEPIYDAQDSPQQAVSPMEEYAGLRARHEGLMKQHAHLRDEVVGHLRESIARLQSEIDDMAQVRKFLDHLHPNTVNMPADPMEITLRQMEIERRQYEATQAGRKAYGTYTV